MQTQIKTTVAEKATFAPEIKFCSKRWRVMYAGGLPVKFHRNLCGDVFELVAPERATVFASDGEAVAAAVKAGIRQYSLEEAE